VATKNVTVDTAKNTTGTAPDSNGNGSTAPGFALGSAPGGDNNQTDQASPIPEQKQHQLARPSFAEDRTLIIVSDGSDQVFHRPAIPGATADQFIRHLMDGAPIQSVASTANDSSLMSSWHTAAASPAEQLLKDRYLSRSEKRRSPPKNHVVMAIPQIKSSKKPLRLDIIVDKLCIGSIGLFGTGSTGMPYLKDRFIDITYAFNKLSAVDRHLVLVNSSSVSADTIGANKQRAIGTGNVTDGHNFQVKINDIPINGSATTTGVLGNLVNDFRGRISFQVFDADDVCIELPKLQCSLELQRF
jgi:hypothetical protein